MHVPFHQNIPTDYITTKAQVWSYYFLVQSIKLKYLLEYVHRSMDLVQIISASKIEVLQTWVDVSYAVHTDIHSPTSGIYDTFLCIMFWLKKILRCVTVKKQNDSRLLYKATTRTTVSNFKEHHYGSCSHHKLYFNIPWWPLRCSKETETAKIQLLMMYDIWYMIYDVNCIIL